MEIIVKSPMTRCYIPTCPSETVVALKHKIFKKLAIPVSDQRLFLAGKQLQDRCSLAQYNITHNGGCSIINLLTYIRGGHNVFVKTPDGKTICLEFDQTDTVGIIKAKIQKCLKIPSLFQGLVFAGRNMDENLTLGQYNIQRESTIHLVLRKIVILVEIGGAQSISLSVSCTDTIASIKNKLKEKVPITSRDWLLYAKAPFDNEMLLLDDLMTLTECDISKDTVFVFSSTTPSSPAGVAETTSTTTDNHSSISPVPLNVTSTTTCSSINRSNIYKESISTGCGSSPDNFLKQFKAGVAETTSTTTDNNSSISPVPLNVTSTTTCSSINRSNIYKQSISTGCGSSSDNFLKQFKENNKNVCDFRHLAKKLNLNPCWDEVNIIILKPTTLHQVAPIDKYVYTITGDTTTVLIPEGSGIQLFVPKGVVPPGVSCDIAVISVAAGNFVFPCGYRPVSCVFAIGVSCPLIKPITIDMEHCVVVNNGGKSLSFASAEHDRCSPPYEFKKCNNNSRFVGGSCHGSIDCQSFTLYTMLMSVCSLSKSVASWFTSVPIERYKAFLLYQKSQLIPRKWTVHFIVCKNLNDHQQLVRQKVSDFFDSSEVVFSFLEDEIVLDIPTVCKMDGWEILPHQYPCKILRQDIDMVGYSGADLPMCSIDLFAKGDCTDKLHYRVKVNGVTEPDLAVFFNCYLNIEAKTYNKTILSTQKSGEIERSAEIRPILSKPTLKELMNHVGSRAPDKFKVIGIGLGIDLHMLNAIEQHHNKSIDDTFIKMFDKWLQQDDTTLTWETVFSVLESDSVRRPDLVDSLRGILCNN